MRASAAIRIPAFALGFALVSVVAPRGAQAQSGKWVGTIARLSNGGGSAEVTVEPRNEKQSRAKISFHNTQRDMRLAWDIAVGSCGDDGAPVAPQAAFTQVQTQMDGSGTALATVPKLESGKRYYVRVYDPQTAPRDAQAFACANLSEKE